jgi:hypothetical protein
VLARSIEEALPIGIEEFVRGEHAEEALEWWEAHKEADRKRMGL